jgi:IS30 family transposase
MVASKLILDGSPEQISGWLKTEYPADGSMHVSHETIHRSLFIQARGVLKKELLDHLRSKRSMRRSRHATVSGQSRGQIVDAIPIRERPAEAEDRAIPGHWEGDLLSGAKNSYIATLVERHSRFAMLIKVPSKETEAVVAALSQHVRKLPTTLKRSLTWDRGLEMAKHQDFTVATDVQVYFCDPQSPWQRGTNENTNLLLRQYFPRGTDRSAHSQAQLDQVALRLNQRPRKTLGFQTPASRLQQSVASTVSAGTDYNLLPPIWSELRQWLAKVGTGTLIGELRFVRIQATPNWHFDATPVKTSNREVLGRTTTAKASTGNCRMNA